MGVIGTLHARPSGDCIFRSFFGATEVDASPEFPADWADWADSLEVGESPPDARSAERDFLVSNMKDAISTLSRHSSSP